MPTTSVTIQNVRIARAALKAWLVRAEALIQGFPSNDSKIPIFGSECGFSRWLKEEPRRLQTPSIFSQLEQKHHDFHRVYADIHQLLSVESWSLGRLLGQGGKKKSSAQLEAEALLFTLQDNYDTLIKLLEIVEKECLKCEGKLTTGGFQKKSFYDVSKMMDDLEKDVDRWLG